MRRLSILALAVATLMSVAAGIAMATPAEKTDVCHYDADAGTFHLINISENAFQKHLDHGDAAPFEPVPGMPTYEFDEACGIYSTEIVDASFVKGALDFGFTAYQSHYDEISGTGLYDNGTNAGSMTLSDVCLNSTDATAWGPGVYDLYPGVPGYWILTVIDNDTSMAGRALWHTDAEVAETLFVGQCETGNSGASGGGGYLIF